MNGARTVVEMLRRYGTEVIFGVPGDTSIGLYEALYDVNLTIRHIMARDERSASFMADAYARLSHRPGVCECPSGAGPLYAIPGIAEANASSIPVILITSDIPLSGEGKQTITELNCEKLFEPVTKWSYLVKHVQKIPETIRRAFRIATTGRPGAVHLALPLETQRDDFPGGSTDLYAEPECTTYPAYRTRGARVILEQLCKILIGAQKPVIIAGGGANHSQAGEAILALAEWLSAPVVTTISGQGIVPDHHPLAMGVTGDNGFHPHAHRTIDEGDVLLYVGCKMGSVSTINWTVPSVVSDKQIVQIDLNPEFLGNNYSNTLSVAGDAKLILEDVLVLIRGKIAHKQTNEWVEGLNKARISFWESNTPAFESDDIPIKPQRVIASLNRHLTSSTVVISDAGTPTPYITRFLKLGGNGSRFIIPRAYGGLGYAIPAIVGAHYARPDARLVGLFGDGSLGMSAGELETLARLNIPAVLIHFNNGMFGWIKALQKLHCREKYFSVDFQAGDMSALAKAFGIKGVHVETPDELDDALNDAFKHKGPVFIDIVSASEVAELPPVFSWEKASAENRM
ncbi:MAG: thiamine pyrophosphate-binding protein [Desulfosarcina sp.]|nr:thiamine pyrophosphate-binding protein [Desulfosarcina sp.]MBC2743412.1 thiamine pyrophosphate-binding protein [Desulfosarcina sp.]MBC2766322.1 thiamine pyrophosphate-binding protein [Desulfosarcina sp.]